jgi:hypothetical protein
MAEIKDMILKTYLKKGARPAGAPKSETHDQAMKATPPAPIPVKMPKTVGNISIAMQAQKIYNPALPPAPPMKAPSKAMAEQGTAPAMDLNTSFLRGNK